MNLKGRLAKLEATPQTEPAPSADQLREAWELATWLGEAVSTPAEAWSRLGTAMAPAGGPADIAPELRAWLDERGDQFEGDHR